MCKLIRKTKRQSFTGYKVVLKIGGKYYSRWTGIEYLCGPVMGVTEQLPNANRRSSFIFDPEDQHNNPDYFGKTGAFKNITGARKSFPFYGNTACILKMVLSGEIWETEFDPLHKTFAGTHIDSIEEIQTAK